MGLPVKPNDAGIFAFWRLKLGFELYGGVQAWVAETVATAAERGYAETVLGRRRPVPELKSRNKNTRQQGERLAVNTTIQGTAADVIKVAMVNCERRLGEEGRGARMLLQVHDELLLECPTAEVEAVSAIVREEMCGAMEMSVPVKVDLGTGPTWDDAH